MRIGINIRRGNIDFGTDDRLNFRGVAARHALELAFGHALGIANDAALGAAVREIDGRGLPRHPGGQRFHFIQRDVRVIAQPALGRAARHIVLHAESGEDLHLAVSSFTGIGNFHDALRRAQNLAQARIELQVFRRHIKLDLRDAKRIQIFARRHPRKDRLWGPLSPPWPWTFLSLSDCCDYALAARCEERTIPRAAFGRTECKTWPGCSKGNEISGETYVPHHGIAMQGNRRAGSLGCEARDRRGPALRKSPGQQLAHQPRHPSANPPVDSFL